MPGEIPSPTAHLVVLTTVGNENDARGLIRGLVDDRVVACGTLVDATSIFRWKGAVTEEAEVLVLLKTRGTLWHELEAAIERRHPYDVPEILALPVEAGAARYLDWVDQETSDTETDPP